MRASGKNLIKIVSTGFIVLMLFSLLLFWLRLWCDTSLLENSRYMFNYVKISPSGLFPEAIRNEPNVMSQFYFRASFNGSNWKTLGILSYLSRVIPEGEGSNVYRIKADYTSDEWSGLYFDNKMGLMVYKSNKIETMPDGSKRKKYIELYAGPDGISEAADKKLGRFSSPMADMTYSRKRGILYDKNLRQFFSIDFDKKTVVKGPQFSKKDVHKPVQIGVLEKKSYLMYLDMKYPVNPPPEVDNEGRISPSIQDRDDMRDFFLYGSSKYLPVLDETNQIYLLDKESLEFAGVAGYLPAPDTLFETKQQPGGKDLLSYIVRPISLDPDRKVMCMLAASMNREGTAIALSAFDPNGRLIASKQSELTKLGRSSSKAIYFDVLWGPVLTICKYSLENLQPNIFSIVSYFTANSFEAGSGHSAMFILPNSFVAMLGRYSGMNLISRFCYAILLILPSIILSILLARSVSKDASVTGLSHNERLLWIICTIAFGFTAYITYRLTRRKITLVTCQNCGKLRRPDTEKCHNCKSAWHVPELTPPSWRVIDIKSA